MKFYDRFIKQTRKLIAEKLQQMGKPLKTEKDVPCFLSLDFTGTYNGTFYVNGCSQDISEQEYRNVITGAEGRQANDEGYF